MKALLLNASYEPLNVITWEEAISMVVVEKAEVLESHEKPISTPSGEMERPSVIRLKERVKPPRTPVKFNRDNVYKRDDYRCQYCGEEKTPHKLTYDHVFPKSEGGKRRWENIVAACKPCNTRKDNRTPDEAGMELLRKPRTPKWTPAQKLNIRNRPKKWEPYLWT